MTPPPPTLPTNILCAAELLEGTDLGNGWKVTIKVPQNLNSTGGNFSVPYFVEKKEGKSTIRAFLKALNFRRLAAAPDFARAVQQHTAAFNFEREICLVATAGLAYFRLGNPTEGKRHYDLAIEAATRQNNRVLRATARLYLAREQVLQNNPEGFKEFQKAHDEAKKFQDTSLPFVAERLAKQIIDVEIKKAGNEAKNITLK